ncbi:MAG: hypothetical protein ABSF38_10580 [Verrucomicrobiota bacterium]|jgi:hypothetical protein
MTMQLMLFVLPLAVSVGVFGTSVWFSLRRPQSRKPAPDSSSRTLP